MGAGVYLLCSTMEAIASTDCIVRGHPLAADQEAQTFPWNFLHFLLLLAAL